ncbi:MAG: response regulator [Chloroflexi bacterium]|nr:response regulator [Chloroflexota bacterium]
MASDHRPTILIADDEETLLSLMETVLNREGRYRLLLAKDGEEALAIARREMPQLVLADVSMPKLNGFEVCRQLKQDPGTAKIKVVLLTGFVEGSYRAKMAEVGADDIFSKPFDIATFREMLEGHWLGITPEA